MQNVSFLSSKCRRLLFTSALIFKKKRHHRHLAVLSDQPCGLSVAERIKTSSRSVCQSAQMLCSRTVCWRFMSQGASGPRGDHIMRMMALLSWVPSQKTRRAGAGRWVTGIQNMLHRTKDISLVVRGWMSCRFGEKQEREREGAFHFVSIGDRLNITQAVCGYPGDGQWWPLMSLPYLTELTAELMCVSRWQRGPTRLFFVFFFLLRFRDEWCFLASSLWADCWSKYPPVRPKLMTAETFSPWVSSSSDGGDDENFTVTINLNLQHNHND